MSIRKDHYDVHRLHTYVHVCNFSMYKIKAYTTSTPKYFYAHKEKNINANFQFFDT